MKGNEETRTTNVITEEGGKLGLSSNVPPNPHMRCDLVPDRISDNTEKQGRDSQGFRPLLLGFIFPTGSSRGIRSLPSPEVWPHGVFGKLRCYNQ